MRFSVFLALTLILTFGRSLVLTQSPTFEELLDASQCEPFDQQPSSCVDFIDTGDVWTVPSYGLTQEYFNGQMFEFLFKGNTSGITLLEITNIMPYECATAYLRLICPTFFQSCTSDPDVLEGTSIPHPVCRSVCDNTNLACSDFWFYRAIPPLNCTFLYPSESDNNMSGPFTCAIPPIIQQNATYQCPQPTALIAPEVDPNSGLPCAVPCSIKVTLVYPEDNQASYYDQYIVLSVLGWISFVLVNITFISAMISPALREFPQRTLLFIGVGLWVLHLGQVGSSFFGAVDVVCHEYQWVTATGSWCKFASFCLFWGSMYTAIWWVFLAFILFWNDILGLSKDERIQRGEYPVLVTSLVWPTLASLILLWYPSEDSSGGYLSGFPFCGLGPEADWNIFWGVLISSVAFCLLCVTVFMVPVMIKSWWGIQRVESKKSIRERILGEFARFLFIASFAATIIAVIATLSWGQQHRSQLEHEVESWFNCILIGLFQWESCPTGSINNSLWWYQNIMLGIIGTLYFITFILVHRKRIFRWVKADLCHSTHIVSVQRSSKD